MFTLIKREIRDLVIYLIVAATLSTILSVLLVITGNNSDEFAESVVFNYHAIPIFFILVIGFSAMGVTQMYIDRNRKISAFLSVLPVTRNRILIARIIAGLITILIALLIPALAVIVLSHLLAPPLPIFTRMISDIFTTIFLTAFTCYGLGLLTGWTSSKTAPTFGALGLTLILLLLIPVKGFDLQIKIILMLVIVTSLVRTRKKFMSTSL